MQFLNCRALTTARSVILYIVRNRFFQKSCTAVRGDFSVFEFTFFVNHHVVIGEFIKRKQETYVLVYLHLTRHTKIMCSM